MPKNRLFSLLPRLHTIPRKPKATPAAKNRSIYHSWDYTARSRKTLRKNTQGPKPRKDFPPFLHAAGQRCKKIEGQFHSFGTDSVVAERKYLDQKDDLHIGRKPSAGEGWTIAEMVNQFLTHKKSRVHTAELSTRIFSDYSRTHR